MSEEMNIEQNEEKNGNKVGLKNIEVQQKILESINSAMNTTAEKLEKTAEKINQTANFFREKSVDSLSDDLSKVVRKHPGKALAGILLIGFIVGKIVSR